MINTDTYTITTNSTDDYIVYNTPYGNSSVFRQWDFKPPPEEHDIIHKLNECIMEMKQEIDIEKAKVSLLTDILYNLMDEVSNRRYYISKNLYNQIHDYLIRLNLLEKNIDETKSDEFIKKEEMVI